MDGLTWQREPLVVTGRGPSRESWHLPGTRSYSGLKPRAGGNKPHLGCPLVPPHGCTANLSLSFTQVSRKSWKSVTSFGNCLWSSTETWGLRMKLMGLTCQTSSGLSVLALTSLVPAAVNGDPDILQTFNQFPVPRETDRYFQSPPKSSQWTLALKVMA